MIKPKFDDIWSFWVFKEGLAKVELNGKYGFIDKKGEIQPLLHLRPRPLLFRSQKVL